MKRYTVLSFDVEEFDLPLEHEKNISLQQQMETGYEGLLQLKEVLKLHDERYTFFTTANFAQCYPEEIKQLSDKHEIASHAFYHSSFADEHLLESRVVLEQIINKKVKGIRIPRLHHISPVAIRNAGYVYNSSMNPTWVPGRYNNLTEPRIPFEEEGVIHVPVSVSSRLRLPLFWLTFKNMPYNAYKKMALRALKKDGFLSLYFHPWEFTDLSAFNIPSYVKKHCGQALQERLHRLIKDLKAESDFITMNELVCVCTTR